MTHRRDQQNSTPIVPTPSMSFVTNHRYLDVMTTRPSNGAQFRRSSNSLQSSLSSSQGNMGLQQIPSTYLHAETHDLTNSQQNHHSNLLIEPILLPNLQHVHVDTVQDLEESCLFYPDGHKNRNIRREIESSVIKHHILENNKLKSSQNKDRYRIVRRDIYSDVKGPPLYYTKTEDPEMKDLLKKIRSKEAKIVGTVQVKI